MQRTLFAALVLSLVMFARDAPAQVGSCASNNSPQCRDSQVISSSGAYITVYGNGGLAASFEEVIAGSPSTVSIVVKGCGEAGTCSTLDTYTTVANAIRAPSIIAPYAYYTVTASWTGGTAVSVTVNARQSTAALQGSGAATWGLITGTLSSQTDLQTALNGKLGLGGGTLTGSLAAPQFQQVGGYDCANPNFSSSNGLVGFSINSTGIFACENGYSLLAFSYGAFVNSANTVFGWAPGAADSSGNDTAFSRSAAGVVALGNGGAGDTTGTLKLQAVQMASAFTTSNLPFCASGTLFQRVGVTDATVATPGSAYTGGGHYSIAVQCTYYATTTTYSWIID